MDDLPELILSSGKRDLVIQPALMNAAGFLGFADEAGRYFELSQLGAFVTNTISLDPRAPARPPRLLRFPGGFLLHTGHANPGLSKAINMYLRTWREMPLPVIVNLLANSPDEASRMVLELEGLENVMAVELLVQGEPFEEQAKLIAAACSGELPVIVRMPLTASTALVMIAEQAGAQAISVGPPRGSLLSPDGEFVDGRLYGSMTSALGFETIHRWRLATDLPIIGGCGLTSLNDSIHVFKAGASGVQIDYALWGIVHGREAGDQSDGSNIL